MVPGSTPVSDTRLTRRSEYTGSPISAGVSASCDCAGRALTTRPSGRTTRTQLSVKRWCLGAQPKLCSRSRSAASGLSTWTTWRNVVVVRPSASTRTTPSSSRK